MSPELVALALAAAAVLWLRHLWHVRRYPDRAKCRSCKGAGTIKDSDWLGRGVKGPCPRCGGDAWIKRRRSER